jgi:serine/threonine-protein kinase
VPRAPTTEKLPDRAGPYILETFLARGGMGEVYRFHDPDLGRSLAVKVLQARFAEQPAAVARFLHEARVTGRLQHPGMAPAHSLGG